MFPGIPLKRCVPSITCQTVIYLFLVPPQLLASASYDDTIKLYADDPRLTDDWDVVATLTGHTSTVWATTFSPCGRFMASCSADQSVRIWKRGGKGGGGVMAGNGGGNDLYSWECAVVLKGHERSVYSISWGKGKENEDSDAGQRMDVDGDVKAVSGVGMSAGWLASTGGDGRVNVWDVRVRRTSLLSIPYHNFALTNVPACNI